MQSMERGEVTGSASERPSSARERAAAEDEALLARALAGNQQAWNAFCRRFDSLIAGCVLRVLRRYTASFTNADLGDLVSEVWLSLLRDDRRRLRLYEPGRGYRLSSWLGLIATNTTIDQLRQRGAEHRYLEDLVGVERWLVDWRRPDDALEVQQSADLARRALERLTPEERAFVVSCFHDERAPTELAAELGITLNTVYSRKFKLRQKLVRIVNELDGRSGDVPACGAPLAA
ncbi:MAG: sigma-70 family RNA polymerase sigma factor [Deltaproteobacteria bacterium]|nr:sigma-70 family RNA polymerase sigma factor [Deltaproteobacteria bacterium]